MNILISNDNTVTYIGCGWVDNYGYFTQRKCLTGGKNKLYACFMMGAIPAIMVKLNTYYFS